MFSKRLSLARSPHKTSLSYVEPYHGLKWINQTSIEPLPEVAHYVGAHEDRIPNCHYFGQMHFRISSIVFKTFPMCLPQEQGAPRLDPWFLPKCVSPFHLGQDIFLPTLYPNPSTSEEKRWHTLDVHRALKIYLACTHSCRRSDRLFITISPPNLRFPISAASLSRLVRETIAETYKS